MMKCTTHQFILLPTNTNLDLKQNLSKKYNIILSIGDQWPDVEWPESIKINNCLGIKLP